MQDDHNEEFEVDENGYSGPSKTTLKKESHAMQDLGVLLSEMNDDKLARIPLDETLHRAVLEFRSIRKFAARKRHMQFLGKLIRNSNYEAIQAAADDIANEHITDTRRAHLIEQWRDRFMGDAGNEAMNEFFDTYPAADRQQIRQLIKNALKEKSQNKPPVSARKLFKVLRTALSASADEVDYNDDQNDDYEYSEKE